MNTGICYTQSGSTKKYEEGLISFSPDRVKFVGIDNYFVKPFIPWMFTPSNHPPEVSLEEGTVMYVVGVRNIDDSPIDLSTYLSYTPPYEYELVSEDHKYDTGVKEYYVSKYFSITEPVTLYYGTAGKTITDLGLNAGKDFYYKKKTNIDYLVTLRINGTTVHCSCKGVTGIPGTNNGNYELGLVVWFINNTNGSREAIHFDWKIKDGINETKSFTLENYTYERAVFATISSWHGTDSDGVKANYTFVLNVIR